MDFTHTHNNGLKVTQGACPVITSSANGWALDKTILVCNKRIKETKLALFEGDSVVVTYDIDARSKQRSLIVVWPVLVRNDCPGDTSCLAVGFSVESNGHRRIFNGFENTKPVLRAGECHTYVLNARIPDCDDELKLSTANLIRDNSGVAEPIYACVGASDRAECDSDYELVDRHLNYESKISGNSKQVQRNAEYTMGDNVVSCDHVVNVAKILQGGNTIAESHTSIEFKEASVELVCDHLIDDYIVQWCVCQSSKQSSSRDAVVEYCVSTRPTKCSDDSKVHLTPTIRVKQPPSYKKEFVVTVYDDRDHHRAKPLHQESVMIGDDCDKVIRLDKISIPCGDIQNLVVTLTSKPVVFVLATSKVERRDTHPCVVDVLVDCQVKRSKCVLSNKLTLPNCISYRIHDKGTFKSADKLMQWLRGESGKTVKYPSDSELKWTLAFSGSGVIANTVCFDSDHSKGTTTVTNIAGRRPAKRDHDSPHDDDTPNHDCDCGQDDCTKRNCGKGGDCGRGDCGRGDCAKGECDYGKIGGGGDRVGNKHGRGAGGYDKGCRDNRDYGGDKVVKPRRGGACDYDQRPPSKPSCDVVDCADCGQRPPSKPSCDTTSCADRGWDSYYRDDCACEREEAPRIPSYLY